MALPSNKIKKINTGGTTYDIVPEMLQNNGYSAELPTLSANDTLITSKTAQTIEGVKTFTSRPQLSFTARLPNTYQEVKYIQASGSQYIDTGFKTTTEKLKVEFACAFPFGIAGMSLMGSNSPYNLVPYGNGNNTVAHWVGSSSGIMSVDYETGYNEVVYILNNGSISCTINGATTSDTYSGSIINNYNFYIFGKNGGGNSAERGNGYKLYYMKIYNNDTLVRNLVPCYRKSDNEIGLYDLVNSVFYTNAGSGTFAKGANVSSSEFLVESDLASVAISGDYNDLENKPTIPTDTNYYPIRSYTSGLQISSYTGSTNCQLYVPYATNTQAGVVSTAAQTFAGAKTFNDSIIVAESDATLTMYGTGITNSYDDGTYSSSFELYAADDGSWLNLVNTDGTYATFTSSRIESGQKYFTYPSASGQLATTDNITQVKTQTTGSATSIQMKFWQGTQSQYDAITTKDSNTLYIIKTS